MLALVLLVTLTSASSSVTYPSTSFLLSAKTKSTATALEQAIALYNRVELEAAAARFHDALVEAKDDVTRARVYAWLGLVDAQLGKADEAKLAFVEAVKLDHAVMMPALAPADVEAMLEDARAANATATEPAITTPDASAPPAPSREPTPSAAPWAVGGVGVALCVASGAVFAVGLDTTLRQAKAAKFNDDARALLTTGYVEYGVASALAVVGATGVVVGAVLLSE